MPTASNCLDQLVRRAESLALICSEPPHTLTAAELATIKARIRHADSVAALGLVAQVLELGVVFARLDATREVVATLRLLACPPPAGLDEEDEGTWPDPRDVAIFDDILKAYYGTGLEDL